MGQGERVIVYFTADHHFGHANVIQHCDWPFASAHEMDETLIDNWNESVKQHDTVYILGDLFFRNKVPADVMLKRLNGKKYLIIGNHDKDWMKRTDLPSFFESVSNMVETSDGAHKLTLCYYPFMTWGGASRGSYMIYGHIHNNTNAAFFPLICSMPNLLNAGVDINGCRPVSFAELVDNNARFKEAYGS